MGFAIAEWEHEVKKSLMVKSIVSYRGKKMQEKKKKKAA